MNSLLNSSTYKQNYRCAHALTQITIIRFSPPEKVTLSPRHPLAQIHDRKPLFLHKKITEREAERKKNTCGTGRQGGGGDGGGGGRVRAAEQKKKEEVEV